MKTAAAICFALGTLIMFGTQTFLPDALIVPGYFAVFFLFVVGIYITYGSEL